MPSSRGLSRAADLPVVDGVGGPCPGAFDDWLVEVGIRAIVYEVEHAGLPALCTRHLPGLEALVRATDGYVVLTGPSLRVRRGLMYSTPVTAARLCVVSTPSYGASNVPEVGGTSQ